jgi:hypothetical protein
MRSLLDAIELSMSIEMANIPDSCTDSAAASWLAVNRKLACWVTIYPDNRRPTKYDLRFGREAKAE